jgi:uncharacterized protein (DUF302 family)
MTTIGQLGFEVHTPRPYDAAIGAVTEALKKEGFGILTQIDVRATMRQKLDAEFRPYAILGACNPALAHRALMERADAGLLLPCNVTVESTPGGGSIIRIADPLVMLQVAGLEQDGELRGVALDARERLWKVAEALRD